MKGVLKVIGIILSLILVGVASSIAVIAILLRQQEVRVPDITNRDIVTAIEVISEQGLQIKVERREPSQTVPKDAVISQTPSAGSSIKKGRPVKVVVSLGPSELQAPDLVGQHFRKAEMELRRLGFFLEGISRVASDEIPRDIVIAQDPPAGAELEKGGRISLLISGGKRPEIFIMPELVGKRAEEAVRLLDRYGLQYRMVYKTGDRPEAARVVLAQKPRQGYPIQADGIVELVVNK